ncbi:ABC transporter substrate-binding protein [Streptomyces sp. MP131-18]|uniref:ABC transporter substrate-binding protein n=1 Tax=Streptomyces sp. MP131-18 TaxID=1857892 RepID=UPI00097BDFBB|nr:ABC transporter substrate-binding protein [Streptomyces sp. MP131-18]ONK09877.1 alkanesulfonate transporter substrate-binding subunit [Streptomyces sp. MP131-18]
MRHRMTAVAAAGAVVFGAGACGAATSPADGANGAGAAGEGVVRVGETDGVPSAFLKYGEQQGFFEEHGIDLRIDTSAGGAAAIPALVGGNLDIAGSNVVSGMLAAGQGLPLRMVAPGTFATDDVESDFSSVLVPEDSAIASAEDLAGTSIAVNTLQNIGDITIMAALEERGVDTSGIEFVELGFPDMLPALESGRVDAAWIIEPFQTMGVEQGFRPVLRPYAESMAGLQVGSYLTTQQFAEDNADLVEAFDAAVADTAASITEDPAGFRAALPEIEELDPAVADAMVLPQFKSELDESSLEFIADRMLTNGFVDDAIDLDALTGR